jgi:hypothetical protein
VGAQPQHRHAHDGWPTRAPSRFGGQCLGFGSWAPAWRCAWFCASVNAWASAGLWAWSGLAVGHGRCSGWPSPALGFPCIETGTLTPLHHAEGRRSIQVGPQAACLLDFQPRSLLTRHQQGGATGWRAGGSAQVGWMR